MWLLLKFLYIISLSCPVPSTCRPQQAFLYSLYFSLSVSNNCADNIGHTGELHVSTALRPGSDWQSGNLGKCQMGRPTTNVGKKIQLAGRGSLDVGTAHLTGVYMAPIVNRLLYCKAGGGSATDILPTPLHVYTSIHVISEVKQEIIKSSRKEWSLNWN